MTSDRADETFVGRFRGRYFEDFTLGEEFHSAGRTITEADVVAFANLSWDHNPIHVNQEFASRTLFRSRIAHGALTLAVATGFAHQTGILEGTTIALASQNIRYLEPVRIGDTLSLKLWVSHLEPVGRGNRGLVTLSTQMRNQTGKCVAEGEWVVMIRGRERKAKNGPA